MARIPESINSVHRGRFYKLVLNEGVPFLPRGKDDEYTFPCLWQRYCRAREAVSRTMAATAHISQRANGGEHETPESSTAWMCAASHWNSKSWDWRDAEDENTSPGLRLLCF